MKQVIVARGDLEMGAGKLAAQVAHGAVSAADAADPAVRDAWLAAGQRKVVLRAPNEAALHDLEAAAVARDHPTALITDAGHTELDPGTVTVLAIGPAPATAIDEVTGTLPLY
ncbi:MAG: peptidyl-tRNA hydrolase Pth2 [Halobacteriales archaeon]